MIGITFEDVFLDFILLYLTAYIVLRHSKYLNDVVTYSSCDNIYTIKYVKSSRNLILIMKCLLFISNFIPYLAERNANGQ
jgi:hypothetical protein